MMRPSVGFIVATLASIASLYAPATRVAAFVPLNFHRTISAKSSPPSVPHTIPSRPSPKSNHAVPLLLQTSALFSTTETSSAAAAAAAPPVPRISQEAMKDLAANGYAVIPNFLPEELVSALREDVLYLRLNEKFKVARIGQDSTNKLNTDIRVAETCFVGRNKLADCPDFARDRLYDALDAVRSDLSGNSIFESPDKGAPSLDTNLSELLYAYYPKGGFYRRHRDAIPGSASVLRCYSLLLYLNEDWKADYGGELRMHLDSGGDFLPAGEEPNFINVLPQGGTLVLFKSELIPHEVLDTMATRTAVVGWYNRAVTAADMDSLVSDEDKVRAGMLLAAAALVTGGLVTLLQ